MYNGWIKLHRSLLDWEWFDEPNTFRLFMYCLLRANHKPKNYRGKLVQVGSFLTSREALSRDTGLSERQVRTALYNLKTTNELTIVSSRQGTVIQVNNYELYQSASNETTDQTSNKRPTSDQQTTSNNNDKNKEEVKEETPPTPKRESVYPFDDFWNDYDKKKEKPKCERKWKRISEKDKAVIKERLPLYVESTPDKTYRKNPYTWLNGQCWEDEIETPKKKGYTIEEVMELSGLNPDGTPKI